MRIRCRCHHPARMKTGVDDGGDRSQFLIRRRPRPDGGGARQDGAGATWILVWTFDYSVMRRLRTGPQTCVHATDLGGSPGEINTAE